jgi:hypothetical protein
VLSTYLWTGNANDGDWNTAGNWTGAVPQSGPADIKFQNQSPQTITLSSADATLQINSLTLQGASITLQGVQGQQQPLDLSSGVSVTTDTDGSLTFCPSLDSGSENANTLALNFSGGATINGPGGVSINNQSNDFPTNTPSALRPIKIGGGPVTLGSSTGLIGSTINVNQGSMVVVPFNSVPNIGSLTGAGPVEMQGRPDGNTGLNFNVPGGATAEFDGVIEGSGGTITMNNAGNDADGPVGIQTIGSINPSGSGAYQVNVESGTLLVTNLLDTGSYVDLGNSITPGLDVDSGATFGGPGSMNITGLTDFASGSTFAVSVTSDNQYTQLTDTNSQSASVELDGSILAFTLGYAPVQGDRYTIISDPDGTIDGQFASTSAGPISNDGKFDVGGVPFQISYSSTAVTIVALATVTTTQLKSSANPSEYGAPVTLTAHVGSGAGPIATGAVTFSQGNMILGTVPVNSGGTASLRTTSLRLGTNAITARYQGVDDETSDVLPSSSTSLSEIVAPDTTTTNIVSSANPSYPGLPVTFTANVTSSVVPVSVGTVTFSEGGTVLGTVAISGDGTATFTTSSLAVGSDPITASFAATVMARTSSTTLSQAIVPYAPTVSVSLMAQKVGRRRTVYYLDAVVATTIPGALTPTGTVAFKRGTTQLGKATLNTNGVAMLKLGAVRPRKGLVTASYKGNGVFSAVTSRTVVQ